MHIKALLQRDLLTCICIERYQFYIEGTWLKHRVVYVDLRYNFPNGEIPPLQTQTKQKGYPGFFSLCRTSLAVFGRSQRKRYAAVLH